MDEVDSLVQSREFCFNLSESETLLRKPGWSNTGDSFLLILYT